MALDHSLTYKQKSFKNIVHQKRLKKILGILDDNNASTIGESYLDIGCSNGYITKLISEKFKFAHTVGMDYNEENLEIARNQYPGIEFESVDLNVIGIVDDKKFNLITCFETLEHVGNLNNAVQNILSYGKKDNFFILISVPIEIGFWGTIKFLFKKIVYRYKLSELPNKVSSTSYFKDLVFGGNISKYRDERAGWGTHFGFDYREIDKILDGKGCTYKAKNSLTTRFYHIKPKMESK